MSLEQYRLPSNWVPGKGLGLLQPKRNQKIRSSLGRENHQGWRHLAAEVKDYSLPLWDPPQPLWSGRKVEFCNTQEQFWGWLGVPGRGLEVANKGLPSGNRGYLVFLPGYRGP